MNKMDPPENGTDDVVVTSVKRGRDPDGNGASRNHVGSRVSPNVDNENDGNDRNDSGDNSGQNRQERSAADKVAPSLLRVGLSAGFINLAQRKGRSPKATSGTSGTLAGDDDSNTLTLIKTAQGIASQPQLNWHGTSNSNARPAAPAATIDAVTLAALSALGQSPATSGVLVNVIDPSTPSSTGVTFNQTSPSIAASPPPPPSTGSRLFKNPLRASGSSTASSQWDDASSHSTHGASPSGGPPVPLNLFSKLASTFHRDYSSTLHSLSYSNPRTTHSGTIAHLPVKMGLTTQPVMDPARWHEGPYCHIYIAPCENLDHYRVKVRPAIRAFVNQIEGSGIGVKGGLDAPGGSLHGSPAHHSVASNASTPSSGGKPSAHEKALAKAGLSASKSSAAGNFGSRYIIVFVPIGANATSHAHAAGSAGNSSGTSGGGGGFGGFRAGRKTSGGGVIPSSSGGMDFNSGHRGHAIPLHASYSSGVNAMMDDASESTATTASSTDAGSSSSFDAHHAAAAAALPPGPIAHSSKEVKELYHKFMKDFPNGRTVILGTLLDASSGVGAKAQIASMSPLKNQEWKAFLHNLGGAIVDGFGDRVKRYHEELRRLDGRRATFVRQLSGDASNHSSSSSQSASTTGAANTLDQNAHFDLSHFFLVKESLAFTYEQMRMPDEAKLQYEELEAFLPENTWRQLSAMAHASNVENGTKVDGVPKEGAVSPSDLALAGDSEGFRRYIKSSGRDLRGVSQLMPQYMYSREVRLMFQMGAPVDVLIRSKQFLARGHHNQLLDVSAEFAYRWKEQVGNLEEDVPSEETLMKRSMMIDDRRKKEAEVEAWALSSCWDIKCASEHYFTFSKVQPKPQPTKERKRGDYDTSLLAPTLEERNAARCLAELLEFGILRLLRLGDLVLGEGQGRTNPIRRAISERPADTLKPWEPWRKLHQRREELKARKLANGKKNLIPSEAWISILPQHVSTWLRNAFINTSSYEETYLELAEAAVLLNRRAGRFRFASRLEDHRAEVLISREEYNLAASILSNNVGACARDQWNRAHYWRIFRLACCQRMSGDVLAYLETLTQSFNPRLASVAPKKTASLFQKDLEAIITDAAVAEPRWGAFPFLETELSIKSETAGKASQPLPFIRRKLTKHLCFVGDILRFALSINSHLPRPIAVNGIRLYLVTFEKYEHIYRRNGIVTEEDAFRILTINSPIVIETGKNQFSFEWQPMTYDSYVLATVEIQWKEASFFYDSALLRKPMLGLDIQPSEPTQTIELNPLFLIPGHVQNVRLVFHSGSDIITDGLVKFICSEGLQVVPPRTDPSQLEKSWSDECIIPLDSCEPGKKIVITTLVKSASMKHGDDTESVQTMRAKVETLYRQESYNAVMEKGEEPESNPLKTLLEAMVTTLDRPALTVDDADAFLFGDDNVMVNVSLQCNTPVPFFIKEWHLDLPPPLIVDEDGDLNRGMFRHAVPEGEILLFGFRCIRMENVETKNKSEKPILRVVLQDDFGKTFLQVLPINLEDIYKQLRKEDIYAELYTANAELICSVEEGTVGHPVPFVYDLNLQSLLAPKRRRSSASVNLPNTEVNGPILYTIVSEGSDWIVSGKVQGLINLNSDADILSLRFRGIPTQSGILRNFPELFLEYLPPTQTEDGSLAVPPITVQCRNPDCFKSLAYTTSTSLAVPAGIDEF